MFTYKPPMFIRKTNVSFDPAVLSIDHCGLFRAPLHLASGIMPSMVNLLASVPVPVHERDQWEVDVKVHMLMAGQYPCIPNWHCDNVPRIGGDTRYGLIGETSGAHDFAGAPGGIPMFIWVSDEPTTEFLSRPLVVNEVPCSHEDVARDMDLEYRVDPHGSFKSLQSNAWYSLDQRTPHRGRPAEASGWRVFARLTHKSIAPARPVLSVIRRHAQVYLDADRFSW